MTIEDMGNVDSEAMAAVEKLNQVDEAQGLVESSEPEQTEEERQQETERMEFDEMTATFTAQMGLASLEGTLKMLLHPRFEFSESAKAEALEKFAPMLVKYGLLLPDFIMRHKQEIEAAKAAFVLAKDGYNNVVQLRQEDALTYEQEVAQTEQATDQTGQETQLDDVA